jgi:hypothetical protein
MIVKAQRLRRVAIWLRPECRPSVVWRCCYRCAPDQRGQAGLNVCDWRDSDVARSLSIWSEDDPCRKSGEPHGVTFVSRRKGESPRFRGRVKRSRKVRNTLRFWRPVIDRPRSGHIALAFMFPPSSRAQTGLLVRGRSAAPAFTSVSPRPKAKQQSGQE